MNRRQLLLLGSMAGAVVAVPQLFSRTESANAIDGAHPGHPPPPRGAAVTASTGQAPSVAPFSVRMPVPPVARPVASRPDIDVYRIPIQRAEVDILPGFATSALTFAGHFVGPTIRARTGRRTYVTFANDADVPTNIHLHGGHVPPASDGHPMDLIDPGKWRHHDYPNRQRGATLWYHAHPHHVEAEHVYRGMHGFYLIEDPAEAELGLPGGEYDVPILVRDAEFDAKGQLVLWGHPANRTTILANGKPQPYFQVAARKYRFRFLNGANERTFTLSLGGTVMTQIASDGGLLPAPVPRTEFAFSPGERVEMVVDFSDYPPGTQLVLTDAAAGPVVRFDVTRKAADSSRVPTTLRALPALGSATVTRDVVLSFDLTSGNPTGLVNDKPFDPNRVDFQIKRGATEIWNVTNGDGNYGFPHNFHLHLVQFRVLDRGGRPPLPGDAGLKDTVAVPPGETVRVQATFATDYLGRYMYHCHFLEHSSVGMMAQMEIVP
ncbi:Multicopper oxidase with three cupredoxin domains (includes cell division protein FtsP and spore coat protein CotA) [Amycolatopsis arida]|uniref:Multicopper oxidase with three cupredoxin domains (Includes cell division protein FtsP and spore coat protein CotA) n=2 Tax=Amycolatopsis arida TaxID=587909 RepID=A0A1I5QA32_9PSEU|nr:FtsP/CotA-like multicopper oxidase with cupredoxin domain [Amycolatopsis arida]SFP43139.1 Multicopper oxidase with three cupredoxin domains (includes cell division protein FtsP and spore coat protein CotA) [Amycolatopsis arida]